MLRPKNAWINEFHYDNDGADAGEFVEVVIQDIATNPASDFDITFYNGSNGTVYDTENVGNCTEGETLGDYVFYSCAVAGIENGAPDGIALSVLNATPLSGGPVLIPGQFLSYEGSFLAVGGPADGVTSTDKG